MDARSYCDTVNHELTAWKAKIYDLLRRAEKLPPAGRGRAAPLIAKLNAAVDELNASIERLSRECPAEFSAQKGEIKGRVAAMKTAWKEVWGVLGEKEYGIGGA
jgi:hypothetical protein